MLCVKGGMPVQLQIREPNGTEWRDCVFAGKAIVLAEVGKPVEVPILPCYQYRTKTAAAGAEIVAVLEVYSE